MDLGCYAAYCAIALLGRPKSTTYVPVMLPTGVDGGGTLVLRYEAMDMRLSHKPRGSCAHCSYHIHTPAPTRTPARMPESICH